MKNIFPGSILMLVLLSQVSFGANPPVTTTPAVKPPVVVNPPVIVNPQVQVCNQQLTAESNAFFQGQASERGAFLKANPDIIAKHDLRFKQGLAIDVAHRLGKSAAGLPIPADEDPAFTAFFQKQRTDKAVFLAKLAQDTQNCLNPPVGTSTNSSGN